MGNLSKIVNKFAVIKPLPVFSKLKWFELQQIANKCAFVEYKKGEIICKEGDPADAFYCLISGRIQAYTIRPNGEKKNIEFLHRGMYFGIISLLTGESHSLTFEAINDSLVLKIEKNDFSAVLELAPRLGIEFSHSLSRRLRSRELPSKSIFESTIISVYGPVKATGSSTYAINLAFHLEKETGKKVILVNINSLLQANILQKLVSGEASPKWQKEGIQLKSIIDDHQKIIQNISRGAMKFDLLDIVFDPLDSGLVNQISHFVSILANDYHYVVVDLPNEMDDVVFKTLTQSDIVHLMTLNRAEDLKLSRQVLDRLKEALKEKFNKDKVQVLIGGLQPENHLSYEEVNSAVNYSVFRMLPNISPQELNVAVVSEDIAVIIPDAHSEYARAVRRIARQIGGVLVGLVLGGGAALGLAHIGVIRVLEKENIPIDVVVGSSMGALIGSLWASGKNADEIESIAREFGTKASIRKLLDFCLPKAGLISGRNIVRWLRRHLSDKTFYNTRIPLKVVAYDLLKREELIIDEGSLVEAVRQSIAIPGVIKPILKKDQLIIDGGVVNPLPTNVVSALGIKKIIAVNVLQSPHHVIKGFEIHERRLSEEERIPFSKSPLQFINVRINRFIKKMFYPNIPDMIMRSLQAVEYVIAEQSAQQADILIHPDLTGVNWFELYQVDKIIKSGEEAAYQALVEIRKLIIE